MTALQIRNLPDDVHRKLKARAAERGQSLSDYAAQILRRDVERMSPDELYKQIKARGQLGTASSDEVVALIRADRDSR